MTDQTPNSPQIAPCGPQDVGRSPVPDPRPAALRRPGNGKASRSRPDSGLVLANNATGAPAALPGAGQAASVPLSGSFQLPPDGFIHVAPLGVFSHAGAGIVQTIDAEAVGRMVDAFANRAPGDPGLLLDFDHGTETPTGSTAAAGWLVDLQVRDSGLWARPRWSAAGLEAVRNGAFRFVSPVWRPEDLERLDNGTHRPTRLLRAALTNDPNLHGLSPITNRAPAGAGQTEGTHAMTNPATDPAAAVTTPPATDPAAAPPTPPPAAPTAVAAPAAPAPQAGAAAALANRAAAGAPSATSDPSDPGFVATVANRLGVADGAKPEDVLVALDAAIANRADLAARLAAAGDTAAELAAERDDLRAKYADVVGKWADDRVAALGLPVANRDALKAALVADPGNAVVILEAVGAASPNTPAAIAAAGLVKPAGVRSEPLHNRATAKPPAGDPLAGDADAKAKADRRAAAIANRAAEIGRAAKAEGKTIAATAALARAGREIDNEEQAAAAAS